MGPPSALGVLVLEDGIGDDDARGKMAAAVLVGMDGLVLGEI